MRYLIFTLVAILCWATLASLAAFLSHVPPFFILAISLLIGGSLSLPKWREWQLSIGLLCVGVVGIFGYHFLLFMALRLAPSVQANLLNYLWPLLILLFTPVFFNTLSIKLVHVIGAIMAFIGAILLIVNGEQTWSLSHGVGYFLAVSAAVCWSCYSLLSKKLANFRSATVGLFCLVSGGLSFVAHLAFEPQVAITGQDWLYLFALGLGPMGIAFYSWDKAIKEGDPRIIATLSYLTPLLSTMLLLTTSEQSFTTNILMSMVLIVLGAFVANSENLWAGGKAKS